MSTKCSSGAVPGGVLGYLSRTPGEAQRSGFAGKRRSKGAGAVFAVRRKRRQADFATTSRHGQSNSPPAGGEIPREHVIYFVKRKKGNQTMRYDSDILYRPPGEWKSYLLQCTIGCSYNKCTFCAMYKEKKFRIRPVEEILEDIDMARDYYGPGLKRVFLMDGDAVIMKTDDLIRVLRKLYDTFPALEKVTTYAGPRSTLAKSPEELRAIREAGLNRAYLGVESGSDAVLKAINKGVTAAQMLEAGQKLVAAGFDLWAIIIMGLTGQDGDWEEHILSTAKMINAMKPRHLSAMTFAPAKGTPLGEDVLAGRFKVCTPDQILEECHLLIEHLDVDPLHFTSNHASNYLPLKGGLPEDKEKFLKLLDEALAGKIRLRKTLNRGI